MWTPSIMLTVLVLGSIDMSTLTAARLYPSKASCEKDVRTLVKAARSLYPRLQINSAGCVPVNQGQN